METNEDKWQRLYEDSKQTLKDLGQEVEDDGYSVGKRWFHDNNTARDVEKLALSYQAKTASGLDAFTDYETLTDYYGIQDEEIEALADAGKRYETFKSAYEVFFPLPTFDQSPLGHMEIPTEDEYCDARDRAEELNRLIGDDFLDDDSWKLAEKIKTRYHQMYEDATYMDSYNESNPFTNTSLEDKLIDRCADEFDMSPAKIKLYLNPEQYLLEQEECEERAQYPSPSMAYIVCCEMEKEQKQGPDGPDGPGRPTGGPNGPKSDTNNKTDNDKSEKQEDKKDVSRGDQADAKFGEIDQNREEDPDKHTSPADD